MGFLTFAGLWFLCGVVTLAFVVWRNPDEFDSPGIDSGQDPPAGVLALGIVAFWPFALLYNILSGVCAVVVRSKREKLNVRDELEKELASARKEVEDLLRSASR